MLLYVRRNRKAHWDGKPRTATSTFTQLLNSDRQVLYAATLVIYHTHDVTVTRFVLFLVVTEFV